MRIKFKIILALIMIGLVMILTSLIVQESNQGDKPFQATGIKIGEASQTQVIIWTRLTLNPQRVPSKAPMPQILYNDPKTGEVRDLNSNDDDKKFSPVVKYPDGYNVDNIAGAVPGTTGKTCVFYKTQNSPEWQSTGWEEVSVNHDYTHQFKLTNLLPSTEYQIHVESESLEGIKGQIIEGRFQTAPDPVQPEKVVFTVVTGQAYKDHDDGDNGWKIYPKMLKLEPNFFIHTGDMVYYDKLAKTIDLARFHWARTYSLPSHLEFHRLVNSYFIKDDHDTWTNDAYPGMKTRFMGDFTFKQGQQVFLDEVPMGENTWRTFRWGKDLQIWLAEGRDFRDNNNVSDWSGKTLWGAKQKEWFKKTVSESDATFRILISPTPTIGRDRKKKSDNHSSDAFKTEGDELRQFISGQKNMMVICGDRHWQYVLKDLKTGLLEFGCGAQDDEHAGSRNKVIHLPGHKYQNVVGGFLAVTVERIEGKSVITLQHYSVEGEMLNEEKISANL